jgi:hypothetical protein
MAYIGKPLRRETVIPLTQPIRAPEPAQKPAPARLEREDAPAAPEKEKV